MVIPDLKKHERLAFQDLMLFRIYEILLVASPYDAFVLEEGGQLTEQILKEYMGMNFNYPPRVWQAKSGSQALDILKKRKIDLVIIMTRIADMDPIKLASEVKSKYKRKPVVLLAFDQSEIHDLLDIHLLPTLPLDSIFIWSGHADVLLAIIKHIEDLRNAKRDIIKGHARAIIFVEDTPKYYSAILPLIYKEIMSNTKEVYSKSESISNQLLHLRARPKILFANNYEQARKFFNLYRTNVLGIISDIRFPRKGMMDKRAGLHFTQYVRKKDATMPIILQSSDFARYEEAHHVNAAFLHKYSATLHQDIRDFVVHNFGFGNFIFRLPSGEIVHEVSSISEMMDVLPFVPDDSIQYHASSNHFSNWFAIRGEFDLATTIRSLKESDFADQNERKETYIKLIKASRKKEEVLSLQDVTDDLPNITQIGSGSMGGKARGLVFIHSILQNSSIHRRYPDVDIRIPQITLIGTDEFDRFMDRNRLWTTAINAENNNEIIDAFVSAELSDELKSSLWILTEKVHYPLAVRSSSILEDSQYRPLAGFYSTFMLTNNQESQEDRFHLLCEAIKRIYASIYFQVPKMYADKSHHRPDEEKMGIIIMELIGQPFKERYYPVISGSAQSINYYPVSYMKREEGVASIALGFGRTVAEGEQALRFSPKYPHILPQYFSIKATMENSQKQFYALPLSDDFHPLVEGEEGNLLSYTLEDAEEDGSLFWAGSVICGNDGIVRHSLSYDGPRVVTFAHVLKMNQFPLSQILEDLLETGKSALGSPVEIEFAINLFRDKSRKPEFCLLQVKPMLLHGIGSLEDTEPTDYSNMVVKSTAALGNGKTEGIRHIIMVDINTFDSSKTVAIAEEIDSMNAQLGPDESYVLIGPGRWGSADPWLGVPVRWNQISKAQVIIEVGMDDYPIDPSFGSHFFQNVTSMRIGYFTINHKNKEDSIDNAWFRSQRCISKGKYASLLTLDDPMFIQIDGNTGVGMIFKPVVPENIPMNEQESTGI